MTNDKRQIMKLNSQLFLDGGDPEETKAANELLKTGKPEWGIGDKLLTAWKAGKTIYNPAYHVRNFISNQILADMSTGRGLGRGIIDYFKAVRNYVDKGKNTQFMNEAVENGLIKRSNFTQVLGEIISPETVQNKSIIKKSCVGSRSIFKTEPLRTKNKPQKDP